MYIKSVVLEGFKSYAQRTEISGFDPMFNAITGLNGSGKSNILDGICFLLGITNLTHVRAVNLNELVYKSGQGSINKATVSITFDNRNKEQSPLGYEQLPEIVVTRQIAIGNKNKYMINGITANNSRVQDLFRSVQLNVNNPHFLIMQGRITKVLNMKPHEILSMIEEATGTRLYESKKEAVQKMMEKKNARIKEMETIITEDIGPTLKKYKAERASYLEYQKIIRELEHLNKFYIAYQFYCCEQMKKKSTTDMVDLQDQVKAANDEISESDNQVKVLDGEIKELDNRRDKEGGVKCEEQLDEAKRAEFVATNSLDVKKEALKAERTKLQQLENQYKTESSGLAKKRNDLLKLEEELRLLSEKSAQSKQNHTKAMMHLQAVKLGAASSVEGKDASVDEQLRIAKIAINTAETELKKMQMSYKHCQDELKKKSSTLKLNEASYKADQGVHDRLKKAVEKLEMEFKSINYEEGCEEKLLEKVRECDHRVMRLREKVTNFEARFHQLHFEYDDPEPNFDRSKVLGFVATLINVKDPKYATALEVVAGGRLYQVVVDSEQTAKKLLDRGRLRKRVTIIPLNKISGNCMAPGIVRSAEALVGKENVNTALDLITFDPKVSSAMNYVFGNSFVCTNMEAAKRVTFAEGIKKKSVTLAGDSFDPAGLASGGSRAQSESILLRLNDLKSSKSELSTATQELRKLNQEYAAVKDVASKWNDLRQQLDLKRGELQTLSQRLKSSAHGQQLEDIETIRMSISELEEGMKKTEAAREESVRRAEELEDMVKNKDAVMKRELQKAEADLARATNELKVQSSETKNKEQEYTNLNLELEDLGKEQGDMAQQVLQLNEAIHKCEHEVEEQMKLCDVAKEKVAKCKAAVDKFKDLMKGYDKEIQSRMAEQQKIISKRNNLQLHLDELGHKISKLGKESKDVVKQFEQMLAEHPWIVEESKFFNVPNTAYDFKVKDPGEALKKINGLKHVRDKLSKNVNMKAMTMLGQTEERNEDVEKKREMLVKDKEKINSTICELDEKKNQAVKSAFTQVNKDFGSIFSTLLPGASAKLVPVEDANSILIGLEFRIGFGDVWKESLSELSGGQRSLVALSLILALLLFKPAPLYILDEVDAALDVSHTQNIGQMLKAHFQHSQFIIVSLKEGMFNNANVLFRTKFIDGSSTVTRYAQAQQEQKKKKRDA